jgi:hypothetical protein
MNETNGRQKWKRFTSIWRLSISAVYPTLRFRAKVMLGLPPTYVGVIARDANR